jgi:hypothetical protein
MGTVVYNIKKMKVQAKKVLRASIAKAARQRCSQLLAYLFVARVFPWRLV